MPKLLKFNKHGASNIRDYSSSCGIEINAEIGNLICRLDVVDQNIRGLLNHF